MALLLKGNFELQSGIVVNEVYSRTNVTLSIDGKELQIYPQYWVSKNAFKSGKENLSLIIYSNFNIDYDRSLDGDDLLLLSNQKVKQVFENLGYEAEIIGL